jgi:hypothetical protein
MTVADWAIDGVKLIGRQLPVARLHHLLGNMLGITPEGAPSGSEPPPIPRNQIN